MGIGRVRFGPTTPVCGLLFLGDVAWLTVWSIALGAWLGGHGPILDAPVVALVVLAGAVLPRLLFGVGEPGDGRPDGASRVGAGALGLAAALLVSARYWLFPSPDLPGTAVESLALVGIVVGLIGWWRGLVLGRSRGNVAAVESSFRLGVAALCLLLALVAIGGESRLEARDLTVPTFLFLGSGLVALPLSRVIEVGELARRREGRGFGADGAWLGLLAGLVAALLVVTLLLANLATFERIDALLRPIDRALSTIVYIVLLPFAFLFVFLYQIIGPLLTRRGPGGQQTMDPGGALLEALRNQQSLTNGLPPELLIVLKVVVVLALAAGIVYALARAIPRSWGRPDADETAFVETREILLRWPGWRALLARLLAWLASHFRQPAAAALAVVVDYDADASLPRGVRALYRDFLTLAASADRPRRPAETPAEYATRLAERLPGETEVGEITAGYVRARYARPGSASSESDEREIGPLAAALARLRALWGQGDSTEGRA